MGLRRTDGRCRGAVRFVLNATRCRNLAEDDQQLQLDSCLVIFRLVRVGDKRQRTLPRISGLHPAKKNLSKIFDH
jgi:hypothetical protein